MHFLSKADAKVQTFLIFTRLKSNFFTPQMDTPIQATDYQIYKNNIFLIKNKFYFIIGNYTLPNKFLKYYGTTKSSLSKASKQAIKISVNNRT